MCSLVGSRWGIGVCSQPPLRSSYNSWKLDLCMLSFTRMSSLAQFLWSQTGCNATAPGLLGDKSGKKDKNQTCCKDKHPDIKLVLTPERKNAMKNWVAGDRVSHVSFITAVRTKTKYKNNVFPGSNHRNTADGGRQSAAQDASQTNSARVLKKEKKRLLFWSHMRGQTSSKASVGSATGDLLTHTSSSSSSMDLLSVCVRSITSQVYVSIAVHAHTHTRTHTSSHYPCKPN